MEDLMMFLIFAICDLMVVLLCRYAFGKRDAYSEGMLLGVHIPGRLPGAPGSGTAAPEKQPELEYVPVDQSGSQPADLLLLFL